ncbi:unnamed protein product [Clonostachys solani]|uniref:Uncharacterized protein n=1 Tax=Clonostachys solani TaxID=160281 RepID=A0A9N9ZEZ2_9HYPO|nr:unnamed protein product [Clonostachys solani]
MLSGHSKREAGIIYSYTILSPIISPRRRLDLATTFHSSLYTLATALLMRPIILIAHSLGGLIIKEFPTTLGDKDYLEVFTFYKTLKSLIAQKENSAEYIYAITRTYSNMVKFRPQDHEYTNVHDRLRGLTQRALISRTIKIQILLRDLVSWTHLSNN